MTFDDLKPGDKVFFYPNYETVPMVRTVYKVLKAHVVVGYVKFKKINGREVGPLWSSCRIKLITPETTAERNEALKQRMHNILVNKLYKMNWREQSDETITAVAKLLGLEVEP